MMSAQSSRQNFGVGRQYAGVTLPTQGFPTQGKKNRRTRVHRTLDGGGKMKRFILGFAVLLAMTSPSLAANIGVSMAKFDDNFLTVLRNGMQDYAATKDGVNLQVEDAQNDVSKQLSQIQNFIAQGVDAIIV